MLLNGFCNEFVKVDICYVEVKCSKTLFKKRGNIDGRSVDENSSLYFVVRKVVELMNKNSS